MNFDWVSLIFYIVANRETIERNFALATQVLEGNQILQQQIAKISAIPPGLPIPDLSSPRDARTAFTSRRNSLTSMTNYSAPIPFISPMTQRLSVGSLRKSLKFAKAAANQSIMVNIDQVNIKKSKIENYLIQLMENFKLKEGEHVQSFISELENIHELLNEYSGAVYK